MITDGVLLRNEAGDWAFQANFQHEQGFGYVWPFIVAPPRWSVDLLSWADATPAIQPFEPALVGLTGAVAVKRERLYLVGYVDPKAPGVVWP